MKPSAAGAFSALVGTVALVGCLLNDPAAIGRVCGGNAGCGPDAVCDPTRGVCVADDAPAPDLSQEAGDGPGADGADGAVADSPASGDGPAALDATDDGPANDTTLDGSPPDLASASCSPGTGPILAAVALETGSYVALATRALLPQADVSSFRLVISTDATKSLEYTFPAQTLINMLETLRVVGGKAGLGELSAGAALPLEANNASVAVALYDAEDRLVDYVAIGAQALAKPPNVDFVGGPIPLPGDFEPAAQHLARVSQTGQCPSLLASDWAVQQRGL